MYIVKVGDQPYVGMELGVWDSWDDAVKCVERYIEKSAYFINWVKQEEGKWSEGSNWIHIYELKLNQDLY